MCRAFEETRKEGIAIGLAQGEEKAMLNMLGIIKHLMKSQNLSARQAMEMLGLSPTEQAKYMEKLG